MFIFHAMGMNYRHDSGFCIDRPSGSGDMLLLFFKTEARVIINGETVIATPRSVLLYRKDTPQYYGAYNGEYINHFLHMDCTDETDFFARAGFPPDTVVTVPDQSGAEELLRLIGREEMGISPRREEYMDMLIKMLIMKLADGMGSGTSGESISPHGSVLDSLRAELYANAGSFGSVTQLAKSVNLSPSRFQQLYRERFGVSCYDDLLRARIKAAQYYLKNTALTVREIAALCGYENDVCFMRLFKRKTGFTPMEFRRGVPAQSVEKDI